MNNLWKFGTIGSIIIILVCLGIFIGRKIGETEKGGTVAENISFVSKTNTGLSDKNRAAARKAVDAVGEINSVASVGANYMQYTNALQTARIKFDAALRDYAPENLEEDNIRLQLENAFLCYIDAKEAWNEFIQDGDEYGFLLPKSYSTVRELSKKYGFKASVKREYYKDEVIMSILSRASKEFHAVKEKVK